MVVLPANFLLKTNFFASTNNVASTEIPARDRAASENFTEFFGDFYYNTVSVLIPQKLSFLEISSSLKLRWM